MKRTPGYGLRAGESSDEEEKDGEEVGYVQGKGRERDKGVEGGARPDVNDGEEDEACADEDKGVKWQL